MGSSESGGVRESGSGSIVWVRRRNGSWWPGKILGPNELSASHLMSPRSGTPVKLLGREDASVDWYNLEKSKRVKSFRCGEFDDCIERAEASLGLPAKKREKYARREDAILHALELEKKFLERKYGKLGSTNPVQENLSVSEREKKDVVKSPGVLENGNGKLENHKSCQPDKKVDTSTPNFMEKKSAPLHILKASDVTHPSLEELGSDLNCKLKELPKFGLKAVSTNRTFYPAAAFEDSKRIAVDGHAYSVSIPDPCFEDLSDSDSSLGKRKRAMEGFIEESLRKRRDRIHSFVKFRPNNAELRDGSLQPDMHRKGQSVDAIHRSMYFPSNSEIFVTKQGGHMEMPVSRLEMGTPRSQHGTAAEESTSGSSEETESDSSETHSLETRLGAGAMISDAETCIRTQPRILDRVPTQMGHESSSGDSDELSLDGRSQFYFHDPSLPAGFSKWQLKGKRNVRNINKRSIDRFTHGTYLESRGGSMSQRTPSHSLSYYHDNGCNADFMEDELDPHSQGLSKSSYVPSQDVVRRQNFTGQNMIDWDELAWGRPLGEFWEDRGGFFNRMFGGRNGHNLLIDVDLEVQANRKGGEHVPWVSLMSRLNGKAIIGHPIQTETLDDGSTDVLVLTNDAYDDVKYDSDRNKVPPVWRTAKRTANFRVPRPAASSSQIDGDEDADNEYIHQYGKVRSKKSNSVRKGSSKKKAHSPHEGRSHLQGTKKPSRKANLSSNQKTKTLSSIGVDQKIPPKKKEEDNEGVMKSMDFETPPMACIPVKLVFSRLLEAVGKPPSAPAKHGSSVNSNKEQTPA